MINILLQCACNSVLIVTVTKCVLCLTSSKERNSYLISILYPFNYENTFKLIRQN